MLIHRKIMFQTSNIEKILIINSGLEKGFLPSSENKVFLRVLRLFFSPLRVDEKNKVFLRVSRVLRVFHGGLESLFIVKLCFRPRILKKKVVSNSTLKRSFCAHLKIVFLRVFFSLLRVDEKIVFLRVSRFLYRGLESPSTQQVVRLEHILLPFIARINDGDKLRTRKVPERFQKDIY